MEQAPSTANSNLAKEQGTSYDTNSVRIVGSFDAPTLKLFGTLDRASHYFQNCLFDKPLSPVMLSLNRSFRSGGYYKTNAWKDPVNTNLPKLPEININPLMLLRQPIEVMSILVHELCHHYHQIYGKPGTYGYHNIEFSKIMSAVGLECSDTGQVGGNKTGRRMTHYIIPGGVFEKVFSNMPKEFKLPFMPANEFAQSPNSIPGDTELEFVKEKKNKTKYTCLDCGLAAWGKPNLFIKCGNCDLRLTTINEMGK